MAKDAINNKKNYMISHKTKTATVTWTSWDNYDFLLVDALQKTTSILGYENAIISD